MQFRELFEGNYSVLSFRIPRRYILSLTAIILIKLVVAATLFVYLRVASVDSFWMDATRVEPLIQNKVLIEAGDQTFRWIYLFLGWDSAWYASIATYGYSFSSQSFAFMPALPLLARLLQTALSDLITSIVICSFVSGILWIPLYESVAEHYMGTSAAFFSCLLFALSPFTMLFTTVAYTEGLFLFLTLASWKLYLDKRLLYASVASAGVTMVRIPGFLIVLPMVLGLLYSGKKGDLQRAVLIGVPTALILLLWLGFMGFSTGDPLAIIHNSEWSAMYTLPTYIKEILPFGGLDALSFPVASLNIHWLLPLAIWGSIILPPVLVWKLRMIDRRLFLYSLVYIAGIFAFGAVVSLPRFMSVLFPLWIPLSGLLISRKWLLFLYVAGFVFIGSIFWVEFISGVFVG